PGAACTGTEIVSPQGSVVASRSMIVGLSGTPTTCSTNRTVKMSVTGQTNQRGRTPETSDTLHNQATIIGMPIATRAQIARSGSAGVAAWAMAKIAPLIAA